MRRGLTIGPSYVALPLNQLTTIGLYNYATDFCNAVISPPTYSNNMDYTTYVQGFNADGFNFTIVYETEYCCDFLTITSLTTDSNYIYSGSGMTAGYVEGSLIKIHFRSDSDTINSGFCLRILPTAFPIYADQNTTIVSRKPVFAVPYDF